MSWIEQVKNSLPEHANDIANDLDRVMNSTLLSEIDRHAIAMAAAIASGNGELAYEISMNGPLFGNEDREIVKAVVANITRDSCYHHFVYILDNSDIRIISDTMSGLSKTITDNNTKMNMYALAASIVNKSDIDIVDYYHKLHYAELLDIQINSIAAITAVIVAIGKIVL